MLNKFGILLTAGQSRRMGAKKHWLSVSDRPLLLQTAEVMYAVCDEVIVIANEAEDRARIERLGLRTAEDLYPGLGPLAGLHAGLTALDVGAEQTALLVGCDLPFLRAEVLADLQEALAASQEEQAAVPLFEERMHPVCAAYRGNVRGIAEDCLREGQLALRKFLARLQVMYIEQKRWGELAPSPFSNMNTPEEFEAARVLWKSLLEDII